jgi:FkbM family methyltransferase
LFSKDDILTVNEIFCRQDYRADESDLVCVDFGSNIGVSAAYFLTRSPSTFVYLFEPLPQNLGRLKDNLAQFQGRFELHEVAVGLRTGSVEFGWEETGRYGGIGRPLGKSMQVPCVDSNEVLDKVIMRHGNVDILKIDIEALEPDLVERLPRSLARCIKRIYVESKFSRNPLAQTHSYRQRGSMATFSRVS